MIIELESITREPKAVELRLRPDEIDLDVEGATIKSDVDFKGETRRTAEKARLRGKFAVEVGIECVRCLEPVTMTLDVEFDDAFIDPSQEPTATEVEADDLDESIAIDGLIDLPEVIREQIILELPEQVFCRDDCQGLCPKCGENRNLIDCNCTDEQIDPRWAALKNLN